MLEFPLFTKHKRQRVKMAFREDIEPHEILLDSLAEKKEKETGFSEKKLEVPLLKKILQVFFIFCFLITFFLFFRTFQLQVVEGKDFIKLSEKNKFIVRQTQAERGVIYDRNLEQLVFNRLTADLVYRKTNSLPSERTLREVSRILKKDVYELKEQIEQFDLEEILIAQNLSHQELILLEIKIKDLPGFEIVNNIIREYKEGETFSHLIGYTGKIKKEEFEVEPEFYSINDHVGRTGVENSYESFLRKNPGKLRFERDVFGRIYSEEIISLPESGKSLVLWLDAELQRKAKEELEKKYKELEARGGVVIAMDPKTGGILSLVSLPGFDNNLFQKGADPEILDRLLKDSKNLNPLFNRAISGRYLTGSVIKPLIALAALEEKMIDPEKNLYTQGFIEIPHRYNPEISYIFRDWTNHGWVDMKKAIAQSCNVYFYTVGGGYQDQRGLGPTKIKEYLELFGWARKTNIDLPGEINGFIPDIEWKRETFGEGWWDGDTYNLSIGQGYLLITPLEITTAFSAVANGGTLYQPKVAKEIVEIFSALNQGILTDSLKTIKSFEPEIIDQDFVDIKNLQIVKEGMRQAVSGRNSPLASAIILNSLPVSSAAKTGTAELGSDRYHNWVTVFAPYEDPEIVLTVMIENVKGVQAAALPVAKEILEWYFTRQ